MAMSGEPGTTLDKLLVNAATKALNVGCVYQKLAGPTLGTNRNGWRQNMNILSDSKAATYLQYGSSCAMAPVK